MPGKVNPTQCEALTMAASQVMGNDVAVGSAARRAISSSTSFKPLIAHNFLQSVRLLADGMESFEEHCARGIEPNRERIAALLHGSLMLVTALAPHIGYDRAAEIAKKAHKEGTGLREAAAALGLRERGAVRRVGTPGTNDQTGLTSCRPSAFRPPPSVSGAGSESGQAVDALTGGFEGRGGSSRGGGTSGGRGGTSPGGRGAARAWGEWSAARPAVAARASDVGARTAFQHAH
jgi:hypothetical protein